MRVTGEHLDQVLHPQFAGKGKVLAKGLAASPGAAVGKVYFTADDADRRRRPWREGHPRAQRDQPRGRPRHDGQPRASSPPAAVSSATPPSSLAAGARPPSSAPRRSRSRASSSRVGDIVVKEGDVISSTARTGEVVLGEMKLEAAEPPRRVRHDPQVGRPGPQGQARPCAPTPTPARTPPTPASSAPRASACAAPSTCSSPPTACRSCAR